MSDTPEHTRASQDIRVHVSAVVRRDGRVLLVQEAKPENHGLWNLPGGHLENGESILAAAAREVLEETGTRPSFTVGVGVYATIRAPDYHALRFVVRGDLPAGEDEPAAGDEILAVRWASLEEIESMRETDFVGPERLLEIVRDALAGAAFDLDRLVVHR